MTRRIIGLAALAAVTAPGTTSGQERQIRVAVTVPGTVERAWKLWTTDAGVRSFFAPGSHIDLRVEGAYEIFFAPAAPPGARGADGMRLLAVEPQRRLAFTWNAPSSMPYVRAQRTVVMVDFAPAGPDSARVTLRHIGWGSGPEWDEAIRYFDRAWNGFVMPFFRYRVERGPVDWAAPPAVAPIHPTAVERLTVAP
jgi:uncharacterized protein YndB with AHSA1/START domain